MSGLFGIVSQKDCVEDLIYGTDYQSHLGTERAGIAILDKGIIKNKIKDISKGAQFKSLFMDKSFSGSSGIGVISDRDPQPLTRGTRHGNLAIAMTGRITNLNELTDIYIKRGYSFTEINGGQINQVELVFQIIGESSSIIDGIQSIWNQIQGSINLLILDKDGIYAARDKWGRFPLVLGQKKDAMAVASESFAFQNTGFQEVIDLQPGQIVLARSGGFETLIPGNPKNLRICAFFWIYTGWPASVYEGVSVAQARINCGRILAIRDIDAGLVADQVSGIPDSGRYHAQGYAQQSKLPLVETLAKYPSYGRSYTPSIQEIRDLIAKMKLIAMPELIKDQRIVVLEDSIVRGTQLRNQTIRKIREAGAQEIHLRPACPPLMYPCQYALSTLSSDELVARRSIKAIEGKDIEDISDEYLDATSNKYHRMVEWIRKDLDVTSLRYQLLSDMIDAIGLPAEKLCLYCWTGQG